MSRASVARVSTVIREANKIRPQKGSEYHQGTNTEREFWNTTLSPIEYVYLIERVHKNEKLGEYFDQKLRYMPDAQSRGFETFLKVVPVVVNRSCRYEYSTSKNKFTILMPVALLHGTFTGELKELLSDARSNIRKGTEGYKATPEIFRTAASDIRPRDDSRIRFSRALLDQKQLDGSYYYKGCKRSELSLMLEVN